MRRSSAIIQLAVVSGLLSVLLAVAVNVATGGSLPEPLTGLSWLAWPMVGILATAAVGLTVWQLRLDSGPASGVSKTSSSDWRPAELPAVPAVFAAYTRTELRAEQAAGETSDVISGFNATGSGNVLYVTVPFVIEDAGHGGTTHGSPWSYDERVPMVAVMRDGRIVSSNGVTPSEELVTGARDRLQTRTVRGFGPPPGFPRIPGEPGGTERPDGLPAPAPGSPDGPPGANDRFGRGGPGFGGEFRGRTPRGGIVIGGRWGGGPLGRGAPW